MNNSKNVNNNSLLDKIRAVSFVKDEITLFLDTHPNCAAALDYYDKTVSELQMLTEEYENTVGPLTAMGNRMHNTVKPSTAFKKVRFFMPHLRSFYRAGGSADRTVRPLPWTATKSHRSWPWHRADSANSDPYKTGRIAPAAP